MKIERKQNEIKKTNYSQNLKNIQKIVLKIEKKERNCNQNSFDLI